MTKLLLFLWKILPFNKKMKLILMRLIQDEFLIAVSGIIFNQKNEILLFKHSYRNIPWALPAGYLKQKEHPREGLEREIYEESGMTVKIDRTLKTRTDRQTARLEICYLGRYFGGIFRKSAEVSEAKFFPLSNLPLLPKDQLFLIQKALSSMPSTSSHPFQSNQTIPSAPSSPENNWEN